MYYFLHFRRIIAYMWYNILENETTCCEMNYY